MDPMIYSSVTDRVKSMIRTSIPAGASPLTLQNPLEDPRRPFYRRKLSSFVNDNGMLTIGIHDNSSSMIWTQKDMSETIEKYFNKRAWWVRFSDQVQDGDDLKNLEFLKGNTRIDLGFQRMVELIEENKADLLFKGLKEVCLIIISDGKVCVICFLLPCA